MNLIYWFFRIFIISGLLYSCLFVNTVYGAIPDELKFTVVFDTNNHPIDGHHDVTFRLYTSDNLKYKTTISNVEFSKGVAEILVGGAHTDLINSVFDDPNMTVSISVLDHQLTLPITSVPYAIRSKESNKARRIDDDRIAIFVEDLQRVGINTASPQVTLDINGGLQVRDILDSDSTENGVVFWKGNDNKFYVYKNNTPVSMSFYPSKNDQSKWTAIGSSIATNKSVGIGLSPGHYALAVTNNSFISESVLINGDIIIPNAISIGEYGFDINDNLKVPSVILNDTNHWVNGNLTFSGILHGNSSALLTNLNHFPQGAFSSQHISSNAILNRHIADNSILSTHVSDQSISTFNIIKGLPGITIADESLTSSHIQANAIQNHHMRKTPIGPSEIAHLKFKKEKFAANSILSQHIVDGEITSDKIAAHAISSDHITALSINGNFIKHGVIQNTHIPIHSIPNNELVNKFSISQGGTGQESFDNQGIIYTSSTGNYVSKPSILSIHNSRMGVKRSPSSDFLLSINDSFLMNSDDIKPVTIHFANSISTWNLGINNNGALNLSKGTDLMFSISMVGNHFSVGTENISLSILETMMLTGELVLGPSIGGAPPGTIKYEGNQFHLCNSTSCSPVTTAAIMLRNILNKDQLFAQQSTIIQSNDSTVYGDNLLLNSVENSKIIGQSMDVSNITNSNISGALSTIFNSNKSNIHLQQSNANMLSSSKVFGVKSSINYAKNSEISSESSGIFNISDSTLTTHKSHASYITNVNGTSLTSTIFNTQHSKIKASNSHLMLISSSHLDTNQSSIYGLKHVSGTLQNSSVSFLSDTNLSIRNSVIYHTNDSQINGSGLIVFGGNQHYITGTNHLSLNGNLHHINANRTTAIGDNISINHDDAILFNTSSKPLSSDRNGQLKIQSDGDIIIQFSKDASISMLDSAGSMGTISDRNLKTSLSPINASKLLSKVKELPIQYWHYKSDQTTKHIGPMAQDFFRLFNFGHSDKIINTIDSDGVLLSSIQTLYKKLTYILSIVENQKNNSNQSKAKATQIHQQLTALKTKANHLNDQFKYEIYKLEQIQKDFDTQTRMIAYINHQLTSLEIHNFILLTKKLWVKLLIGIPTIFIGIACFLLLNKFRRKS